MCGQKREREREAETTITSSIYESRAKYQKKTGIQKTLVDDVVVVVVVVSCSIIKIHHHMELVRKIVLE
jgi:hypothetical protein